jgi:hypothetical protein
MFHIPKTSEDLGSNPGRGIEQSEMQRSAQKNAKVFLFAGLGIFFSFFDI